MKPTFQQLGIPFPLFEAEAEAANEYCGEQVCSICGHRSPHCFELGIGADVVVSCTCGEENAFSADDEGPAQCGSCGNALDGPTGDVDDRYSCYFCLRAGRAALTKDTEYGLVTLGDAMEGLTRGTSESVDASLEVVLDEDDAVRVKSPREHLFELLRTPSYPSWQGEMWLFCCGQPMTFVGFWGPEDFTRSAPDGDGLVFMKGAIGDFDDGLWKGEMGGDHEIYAFRCGRCSRIRANWDMA